MIFVCQLSSRHDFLTSFVLLHFFHASQTLIHTGWLVESLAAQSLVLFVIRTPVNPLRTLPCRWLAVNTIVVLIGIALPWSPLAGPLSFTPLLCPHFIFLSISMVTCLLLVELAKRQFFRMSDHRQLNISEAVA